jgi:hypothetical protein
MSVTQFDLFAPAPGPPPGWRNVEIPAARAPEPLAFVERCTIAELEDLLADAEVDLERAQKPHAQVLHRFKTVDSMPRRLREATRSVDSLRARLSNARTKASAAALEEMLGDERVA